MTQQALPLPGFADSRDYALAREVFSSAGYTDEGILKALGFDAVTCLSKDNKHFAAFVNKTSAPTPLNQLIRLFLLSAAIDSDLAAEAVTPMPLSKWVEAGLVAVEGDWAWGLIKLVPFGDFLIGHDRPMLVSQDARADYVMGIGSSTLTLASITVRRRSRNTLDLGAGCGTHALLAAPHSDRVVTVDRNPRATAFCAFNAAMNDLPQVQCLTGDRFEPVTGQAFDLIVSNPPFVISPASKYIYRDSGMHGDEFCRHLVKEAPAVMSEGGYCQFLCNWAHYKDRPWQERLTGWFASTGCDALVLRTYTEDPATYAVNWINRTEADNPASILKTYEQWMGFFEQNGIEAISGGFISMRKSGRASNWVDLDDGPQKLLGHCGEDIDLSFKLRDFVHDEGRSDATLLQTKLRVNEAVRLNHQFHPGENRWLQDKAELCRIEGLAYTAGIDQHIARLVAGCDGKHTLGELVADLAKGLNRSLDTVTPQAAHVVRDLMRHAFLLPTGCA